MPLFINYPKWIRPQIFPGVPILENIRWYGLMYIVAFSIAFVLFRRLKNEGALDTPDTKTTSDDIFNFFTFTVVFLLLGARLFSAFIYDPSKMYIKKPWLIFWPFQNGKFVGLAGMSYHGGVVGAFIGALIWCLRHKKPLLKWLDAIVVCIPLGYTFGRIGNFINGELYGRITTAPWGMIFPDAKFFSSSLPWVKEFAAQAGVTISEIFVNLPRHPSQLYEAFFEGIVLWFILWFTRKHKPFTGFSTSLYLIGYGVMRFFIEYFRQPDDGLGFRIKTAENAATYLNDSLLNISTGQILCLIMILCGIAFLIVGQIYNKKISSKIIK